MGLILRRQAAENFIRLSWEIFYIHFIILRRNPLPITIFIRLVLLGAFSLCNDRMASVIIRIGR